MPRRLFSACSAFSSLALVASLSTVGCGSGTVAGPTLDGDASTGDAGGDGSTLGDGSVHFDSGSCFSNADCPGGLCIGGLCCSSAANVCNGVCCSSGQACLFDKCVTPGATCLTSKDCASGQYCETALGSAPAGDAGVEAGGACSEPPPASGKCLDRPAICAPGVDPSTGCVLACEVHPPTGKLNAVAKWTWGPGAKELPDFIDVWATPTVGRVADANCDGKLDELDPPDVIFVSGNAEGTCCQCNKKVPSACHTGVLRALDGRDGHELWSLDKAFAGSVGFAGTSVALGDIDADGRMDVVAVTGEGYVVVIGGDGKVKRKSDKPIAGAETTVDVFGWGGGLAIADMDGDGFPEIAYGSTVFSTTGGALTLKFTGAGNETHIALSTFADIDGVPGLELVTGSRAVRADGSVVWARPGLADAFPAIADLDGDGLPEIVVTTNGTILVLDAKTGKTILGPSTLPGTGSGGPPTIADFDGDKKPEIGVAMANFYAVMKPDFKTSELTVFWKTANHDLSSSVTGSSVFDFEGDGRAEVIYNDECYLWVFDGATGAVRFAGLTTSFTGTEASVVADVDGDGRAEIVMISNGADPSAAGWKCDTDPWNKDDPATGRPAWIAPTGGKAYRGITVWGDSANSWVGTRTLWTEHTYHVSNVCDDRDSACVAPNIYGSIPKSEVASWSLPWLNSFRQNVQDKGIFDAPDAIVTLAVDCVSPPTMTASLRNVGLASLPALVHVGIFQTTASGDTKVGEVVSTRALLPGQTELLPFTAPAGATSDQTFVARVIIDPLKPTFRECREDNDSSGPMKASCVH